MELIDQYILKDSRSFTDMISEEIIDLIITSPPYWNLKDYGASGQIGFGQTKEDYLNDIDKVLLNCLIVTKSTGSLWLIIDTYRLNGELYLLPWEISERAKNIGWHLRDLIIWDKQHNVPWQKHGQMRHVTEFILFFSKSKQFKFEIDRIKGLDELSKWWVDFPERFNPKGKTPTNIWTIPVRTRGTWPKPSKIDHHCPFPTVLVSRIIELTTDPGDLVLDPFGGSGVVLAQAAAMGRHFIGFEINQKYIDLFNNIVKNKVAEEWIEIQKWRNIQESITGDFEQTIMRLRALKYTRQVTKPLADFLSEKENIRAVICIADIPSQYQRNSSFPIEIIILVNNYVYNYDNVLVRMRNQSLKAPLTHFGITSTINMMTEEELLSKVSFTELYFYLYKNSKFRKPNGYANLTEWICDNQIMSAVEKNKIPLLANFEVDVSFVPID